MSEKTYYICKHYKDRDVKCGHIPCLGPCKLTADIEKALDKRPVIFEGDDHCVVYDEEKQSFVLVSLEGGCFHVIEKIHPTSLHLSIKWQPKLFKWLISRSVNGFWNWIPCKERLPDLNQEVLLWNKYFNGSEYKEGEIVLGYREKEDYSYDGDERTADYHEIFAWMPLPEEPREMDDERKGEPDENV